MEEGKELGRKEGMAEGMQKGIAEAARQTAMKMKSVGIDIATIAQCTGLSADIIETL
ncbi:MAG: hypothetical protein IKN29_06610 [Bacteroidales bacterium]|nr:hypothetical protein [Bacteroidales bacterium]